jgi:hypothetical protein
MNLQPEGGFGGTPCYDYAPCLEGCAEILDNQLVPEQMSVRWGIRLQGSSPAPHQQCGDTAREHSV